MRVCFTIDLGPDAVSDHDTYRGVTEGTPVLLNLLAEERIPCTFFATGEVARRFLNIVRQIADRGHEIGLLADEHHRFLKMPENDVRAELHVATSMVRRFYRAISYRAAGLEPPERYLHLVEAENFFIDSSLAKYRAAYWSTPRRAAGLLRVPVSVSPATWRLPGILRSSLLRMLSSPVVLTIQPGDFLEYHHAEKRSRDHRQHSSRSVVNCLSRTIRFFRNRASMFVRLEELLPQDDLTVAALGQAEAARAVA
jgi:peptidoglycan/xylan/chitin deacetylase (PgdA/CDA1 family)